MERHQALERDVELLVGGLRRTLVEQEGPAIAAAVDELVVRARAVRERGDDAAREAMIAAVDGLEPARRGTALRALAFTFHLSNLAEQQHRLRRRRAGAHGDAPQRETLDEALARLAAAGVGAEQIADVVAGGHVHLRLVLTAHPTEASRRTFLQSQLRLAGLLHELDDPDLSTTQTRVIDAALAEELAIAWLTDEVRSIRPTVDDEIRQGLWFFEKSLVSSAVALAGDWQARLPHGPAPLSFGTWIGGDQDGNPHAGPETIHQALRRARVLAVRIYRDEIRELARALGLSDLIAGVSDELLASIARDEEELPWVRADTAQRNAREPYRRKLTAVWRRLDNEVTGRDEPGYADAAALRHDLDLIDASLRAHRAVRVAEGRLAALRRRVAIFGLHLASLDVRLHADQVREPDARTRATFAAVAEAQARHGVEAIGRVILSGTTAATDVFATLALAAGAGADVEAVPLFETIDDLRRAAGIVDELLADPGVQAAAARRAGRVTVMVGYSDSAKDGGFLTAQWEVHEAQVAIADAARADDTEVVVFHGRGGSTGRGGAPTHEAILARPPGHPPARLEITEQGETIAFKYGLPGLAERNLEAAVAATLLSAFPHVTGAAATEGDRQLLGELSEVAHRAYRGLVWDDPGFLPFFQAFTPIDELALLELGSRPPRRPGAVGAITALRAIPWVFSWTQTRVALPAWYGVGSALAGLADTPTGLRELRRHYRDWPFFRSTVENVEMALAKSSTTIGRLYLDLVPATPDRERIWRLIADEHERTVDAILHIVRAADLLDRQPVVQRTIARRNPYVDAINAIQVELLRGWRDDGVAADARELLRRPLARSIAGIAAGLRNTG